MSEHTPQPDNFLADLITRARRARSEDEQNTIIKELLAWIISESATTSLDEIAHSLGLKTVKERDGTSSVTTLKLVFAIRALIPVVSGIPREYLATPEQIGALPHTQKNFLTPSLPRTEGGYKPKIELAIKGLYELCEKLGLDPTTTLKITTQAPDVEAAIATGSYIMIEGPELTNKNFPKPVRKILLVSNTQEHPTFIILAYADENPLTEGGIINLEEEIQEGRREITSELYRIKEQLQRLLRQDLIAPHQIQGILNSVQLPLNEHRTGNPWGWDQKYGIEAWLNRLIENMGIKIYELDPNGVVMINGRSSTNINAYANRTGMQRETVERWLDQAGVNPIPGVLGTDQCGSNYATLFWTEEINKVSPHLMFGHDPEWQLMEDTDNAIPQSAIRVTIGTKEILGVPLRPFLQEIGAENPKNKATVLARRLTPIPGARALGRSRGRIATGEIQHKWKTYDNIYSLSEVESILEELYNISRQFT